MKRQKEILLSLFIVVLLAVAAGQFVLQKQPNLNLKNILDRSALIPQSVSPTVIPAVLGQTISIDFGDGKKISGNVMAQTAYDALKKISDEKKLAVGFKQYKYGLMVEKIGETANSSGFSWMYYVNDKAGQIAAGRFVVYAGDKVEWKYEKIK